MTLEELVYSEDYADLIVRSFYLDAFQNSGSSVSQNSFELNAQFSSFFYERRLLPANQFGDIPYNSVPKLFTPLSTVSLESAGILQVQTQPVLSLTGTGVIIGFVDTGIDYTHPAFRKTDGTTRLLAIWDQTDRAGAPPAMFPYGSEYTKEQIDEAIGMAQEERGITLSGQQKEQLSALLLEANGLGLDRETLLDGAQALYEKYGSAVMESANDAIRENIVEPAKDAVVEETKKTSREFFRDMGQTVKNFFVGLSG